MRTRGVPGSAGGAEGRPECQGEAGTGAREGRTRARYGSHDHGHGRRGRSRPARSTTGTKTRLERSHQPGHGVSWEPQNMLGHRAKSKVKGQPRYQKREKKRRKKGRQPPRRRKRPQSICKQISQATWPRTLKGRRENFFFNKNWRGKLCEKSDRH